MQSLLLDVLRLSPLNVVVAALGCLSLLFLAIILHLRRTRSRALATNVRLRKELENRDQLLEKCRILNKDLQARLPETAGKALHQKRQEGDLTAGFRTLEKWLAHEGEAMARLTFARAKWAYVQAALGDRPIQLAAAEGYAAATLALNPRDGEAAGFWSEIVATRKAEGSILPVLPEAMNALENRQTTMPDETGLFGADRAWAADTLETEAIKQYEVGRYRLALAAVDVVLPLRCEMDGAAATSVMTAQSLKGYALLGLGRADEALPIVRTVAEGMCTSSDFGPDDPDTFACRYQLALVLETLGRREEALNIIRDVVERQTQHPQLGPNHPDTADSRKLLHRLEDN